MVTDAAYLAGSQQLDFDLICSIFFFFGCAPHMYFLFFKNGFFNIFKSSVLQDLLQVRAPQMHDEIEEPEILHALIVFCFFSSS